MAETNAEARPLAGLQPPPEKPRSTLRALIDRRPNPFETLPRAVYEQPVYDARSFFGRMVIVSEPEAVRRVLVERVEAYPKGELDNRFFTAMFGEGLLSATGEKWRRHRKVMAPAFDPRSVAAYAPAMAETIAAFRQRWDALADGSRIDMAEEMIALTLQVICRTMFSSDAEELVAVAGDALGNAGEALDFGLLDILPIIGKRRIKAKVDTLHAHFASLDQAIHRLIAEREGAIADAPRDLLTRLIVAKDPEGGAGLTAAEVRDELLTIFVAGHETTAVTMTWVWYALASLPEEEARLHTALDAALEGRAPTAEDLPRLGAPRAFIEETMRLYPPAPGVGVRIAREADTLGGVAVKPGDRVMISPWVLHRHRALWDAPERFDPGRFSEEATAARPRFAYLPFGAGPRICIGANLAMTEATLILAGLAQTFRARLVPGHEVRLQSRITLRPLDGLPMTLERRAARWGWQVHTSRGQMLDPSLPAGRNGDDVGHPGEGPRRPKVAR